jgi:hypothetical protein
MKRQRAARVVSAARRGSSRPIIVETEDGRFFTKLRGAAQGVSTLVAEIIVAGLAEPLGLKVPARALIQIDAGLLCDDHDPEVTALVNSSHGWNLGFRMLEGARDFRPADLDRVDDETACKVIWLDGLVMNPDRTSRNPNILIWRNQPWLIDHGAALGFQHNWAAVTESSPRRGAGPDTGHVLHRRGTRLVEWDSILTALFTRDLIRGAVEEVPDDFLRPLLPSSATPTVLSRRREAYCAFLWKRLKPPRPFVQDGRGGVRGEGQPEP